MTSLPAAVRAAWENREGPVVFTTVDGAGNPNAIYATCVSLYSDDTFVIADNFFFKTRANILAGSAGSLLFITKEGKSFQVKGTITYHSQGAVFEDMKIWNPGKLPGHAAAALQAEHIFSGAEELYKNLSTAVDCDKLRKDRYTISGIANGSFLIRRCAMNFWINRTKLLCLVAGLFLVWLASCAPMPTQAPTAQPTTVEQSTAYSTFTTADFSGPGICVVCHSGLKDESGADVSMPLAWRSTMMANAAKDPIWQAKVSSEVARMPQLQEVIEKKCITCHMPMAKTQAVNDDQPVAALGAGFFNDAHPLHPAAIDGVSCTLCHQVQPENLGSKDSFSGGYQVDTSTVPPSRVIFGPYQQPVAQQMENVSGFRPMYSEHMQSAEHCGTCHNLYTPYVDAEGNILGEFPEQTPYTEWQYSQFGTDNGSCQTCHMPLAEGSVVISTIPGNLGARQPFYQHFFVGGNAFMTQILTDWRSDLAVRAEPAQFARTKERVQEQISSQTAQLSLAGYELKDTTLTAQLQLSTLTGHKFPTSFPSRRAWLHVTVSDAAGNVIFESGRPNPDGTIAGNAADFDAAAYEPHYELITQADQVQIYEPIMGDHQGQVTYTLLRGAQYLKDNRLLPLGAEKAQLPPDIAVYGEAAGDDNFVGGGDRVTYQVDVAGGQAPFTLQAELLYAPLSYRFVADLLMDQTPLTERFGGYYGQSDKTPLLVAALQPATTR